MGLRGGDLQCLAAKSSEPYIHAVERALLTPQRPDDVVYGEVRPTFPNVLELQASFVGVDPCYYLEFPLAS